ncbi:glycosyltransferase family 87 protein [Alicyclobacillus sp. ALC3]|uniref:glycosyltransferase family 87 protein n=1 Tax=Alicyclobacillus sp. ALC3 TaxID=2796143 RepID=UPI00237A0630|nr:glycosyltransferase family 87 protein [Alicyclobacillus sp. ALC3]WDL96137.1 DUF2029 domain-containing protein [Alicyclobacillus sp. ALC3]
MFQNLKVDARTLRQTIMWTILAVIAGGLINIEWQALIRLRLFGYDYAIFYYAFNHVLHPQSVAALYNSTLQQMYLHGLGYPVIVYDQYVYPPQFALFWSFLGLLPFYVSLILWLIIEVVSYGAAVVVLTRMLWPNIRFQPAIGLALMTAVLTPFILDAGFANVDCVLLFSIIATFAILRRRPHTWLAGVPLGLAIAFKVTPIAVVVYLLLRKQWRTAASALATTLLLTAVAVLFVGVEPLQHYVTHFIQFGQTSMRNGPAPYNQSLLGLLQLFALHHALPASASALRITFVGYALVVGLVILWTLLRTKPHPVADMALACLTPLLFSPLVEQIHMVLALPAVLVLLKAAANAKAFVRGAPTVTSASTTSFVLWAGAVLSLALMSLPVTYSINELVKHIPKIYWLDAPMYAVQLITFASSVWILFRQPRTGEPAALSAH